MAVYLGSFIKNLDYFKVKDVMVRESDGRSGVIVPMEKLAAGGVDLSYLKGRNIFSIDLGQESAGIADSNPRYERVQMVRVLPNRIFVDFVIRKPVAYVKLYRNFCVGEDLALFEVPRQMEETALPVITGLETKISGVKPGKKCNVRELALAVGLLGQIEGIAELKDYQVKKVDILNPESISVFLLKPLPEPAQRNYLKSRDTEVFPGMEIRIGQENVGGKVKILSGVLRQLKDARDTIKYIDVRFKEPVIKLKDVKK
jgi:hypothetical protein